MLTNIRNETNESTSYVHLNRIQFLCFKLLGLCNDDGEASVEPQYEHWRHENQKIVRESEVRELSCIECGYTVKTDAEHYLTMSECF
jgi:hypothetical protein